MITESRIILRRGDDPLTAAFVLSLGEPAVDTTTGELKFGDGVRHWRDLPVAGVLPDYALAWYRKNTPTFDPTRTR
jgi:hypothetical protein